MKVDHGGFDVCVSHEGLDRADIGAGFEQMRREGMAHRVAGGPLGDSRLPDRVREARAVLESLPRATKNPRPDTHRAHQAPNLTGRRNCGSHLQQPASPGKRRLQHRAPSATQPQSGGEVLVAMSEEPKDGFGLDKEQRLLAKRLGKEE